MFKYHQEVSLVTKQQVISFKYYKLLLEKKITFVLFCRIQSPSETGVIQKWHNWQRILGTHMKGFTKLFEPDTLVKVVRKNGLMTKLCIRDVQRERSGA